MIRNPEPYGVPLGRSARGLLAAWSLALLAGFFTAYQLEPDPRGFGTHQRLGLPPCTVRALFGIPCPSCGMTTSFANVTKGRWLQAAEANAAGLLLSAVCALLIPWSWLSVFYGRTCWVTRPAICAAWVIGILVGATALQWILRLITYPSSSLNV